MKLLKWIVIGLFAFLLTVFAVANRHNVEINFFPLGVVAVMPVFILFFLSLILGVVIGSVGLVRTRAKQFTRGRDSKKKISALENEVAALRMEKNLQPGRPAIAAPPSALKSVLKKA